MPWVLRDLTPGLANMSKIILSEQLFSHVISLASCPGKCQALNVFVFALVVLRSYWNTSGDLFCIKLLADSDIEKKQVETERGALDCIAFNSDSRLRVCLGCLKASFRPSLAPSPCASQYYRAIFGVRVFPFCSPERLVKTSYLLMNERNFPCVGGTWLMQLWPARVGHRVKGAPAGGVHWNYQIGCRARKSHQQAFSSKQRQGQEEVRLIDAVLG